MQKIKLIDDIVSDKEEYDHLYNSDHLFVLRAKCPDDNDIFDIFDTLDNYDWCSKLRGEYKGPFKIQNLKNHQKWFHGYVFGVKSEDLLDFEKTAMITTLTTDYVFEKFNVFETKKELKDNHFSSLFEEV